MGKDLVLLLPFMSSVVQREVRSVLWPLHDSSDAIEDSASLQHPHFCDWKMVIVSPTTMSGTTKRKEKTERPGIQGAWHTGFVRKLSLDICSSANRSPARTSLHGEPGVKRKLKSILASQLQSRGIKGSRELYSQHLTPVLLTFQFYSCLGEYILRFLSQSSFISHILVFF